MKPTYTLLHEISASPTEPLPPSWQAIQLCSMWDGFKELTEGANPKSEDLQVCIDTVNLMETFITVKTWRDAGGSTVEILDGDGLLQDAVTALKKAAARKRAGHGFRLDGPGIHAVRSIMLDYQALLETLPARTMVRCLRLTEKELKNQIRTRKVSVV